MATTVKAAFGEYASNLNISDRQEPKVSNCRTTIVKALEAKLTLYPDQPSKLIGSYDRDTLIRYLSEGDVDVMVVLHYGEHKDWEDAEGTGKALQRFKSILEDKYTDTPCAIDRNCVTMKLSEFRLDIVPAFRYTDGSYRIPDTYRKAWLTTDPVRFADEITRINNNMGGDFVPLIKMIKGWNRELPKPLRSFHLECIMANRYKNYTQGYTYDSMVKVFFGDLPNCLEAATYDPVSGDRVDWYLDNTSLGYSRESLVDKAKKAADHALEAFNDGEKYPSVAIKEWKTLLGTFFPAYG